MAFGLKRWIGAVVLGCAATAAWGLPPSGTIRQPEKEYTLQEAEALVLQDAVVEVHTALKRLRVRDSLAALVVDAAGPVVGAPAALQGEAVLHRLEARVRGAVQRASSPQKAAVGLFIVPATAGAVEGLESLHGLQNRMEVYAGEPSGRPYCMIVAYGSHNRGDRMALTRLVNRLWGGDVDVVGPCFLYARYGLPGPGIRAWLRDGAYGFGLRRHWPAADAAEGAAARLVSRTRPIFGVSLFQRVPEPHPLTRRCLAADEGACRAAFTALRSPAGNPPMAGARRAVSDRALPDPEVPRVQEYATRSGAFEQSAFLGLDATVLADLEEEFGRERFAAFWRSDAPVEAAFTAAFRAEPGAWMHRWAVARFGAARVGAGVPVGSAVLTLLVAGVFAGLLAVLAQRRQMGM